MTASADLTHAVVLKAGNAFLVTEPEGEIPVTEGHPMGLYLDDCRFLSGHELRVVAVPPRLLVSSAITGQRAVHELTNPELRLPDGRVLPLQTLQVRVDRSLTDEVTMRERIHIHLYGRDAVVLDLDVALAADFVPMLELRGMAPPLERRVELAPADRGVRLSCRGADGVLRSTTVTADPPPTAVQDARMRFSLELEPGHAADVHLTYTLSQHGGDGKAPRSRAAAADLRPAATVVRADDELFNRVLDRSLTDLHMLRSHLDGRAYYAAGVPWFATLFGRDSLIAAIESIAFEPAMAEQTLRVLAENLGRRVDPIHEEEPGKVLHELRVGEVATLGRTPLARYYGSVDSTPLFLCLLAEHAAWSGTLELFDELRPAAEAALEWIDRYGDHDGDGLIDYRAGSPDGLRNQGWKDSHDGVVDGMGRPLEPPIALVEAQAYVIAAQRGVAELFERAGEQERADALRARAVEMEGRLERFWIPERGFYSMGIGGDGRASTALASNQGHLLWAGVLGPDRARAVRDAVMSPELFSGWGIRTLGRGEPGFNPVGYHLGTVWPHDTAMIAAGLRRYDYDEDFVEVFEWLLEAASHADEYRLPELFAGFSRTQFETPVPYPVACRPQAWAAGAIPYLLINGLGLRADALNKTLRVRRPSMPSWLNRVHVANLRVGGSSIDLVFERATGGHVALADASIVGDVEVTLAIGP